MNNIVVKKKNKTLKKQQKQSKNVKNVMVEFFLNMLNTVKMYHWKTIVEIIGCFC